MNDAWKILIDATIKAVLLIAQDKNVELDNPKVASTLKEVMKEKVPDVQQEWKDAVDAKLGEGWLRQLMNDQANEIAILVLKKMEAL